MKSKTEGSMGVDDALISSVPIASSWPRGEIRK